VTLVGGVFSQADGAGGNGNGHLIQLRRVVKVYENAAGGFRALNGVDLTIDRGELEKTTWKSKASPLSR
jgi:hypothetical protein